MYLKKRTAVLSVLATVAMLIVGIHAPANAQSVIQGWYKVCNKQQDVDICNTMNTVVSNTGQPLTVVNLVELKGKQNEKRIGVQVPTGRFLPEGVRIQIGNNFNKVIPYVVCNGPSCIANDILDDALVMAMKNGATMKVTTINFQGTPNPIDITLKGFSAAYNGPGIREQDFVAEQKKLQQAVQAKQMELEKRMRAEQEKAKSGK
ncbi:invasion associated locus B family protein [Bartonella sp. DGB2]|uniref:invasion associated locus B family protein n=1 Tax=Bartonella sp. DGB2 TaxID=3388426 RepID=UPI00398FBB7C